MGFQICAVFSSPVDEESKQGVRASAVARWPFLRLPHEDCYPESAHFAPPELTEYLHQTDDAYERAVEECRDVESSLPDWSTEFPSLVFTFIEVDCFGGTCLYSGFTCTAGELKLREKPDRSAHRRLLEKVGIILKRNDFTPFRRGYFASR